jgi:hypothetical protein
MAATISLLRIVLRLVSSLFLSELGREDRDMERGRKRDRLRLREREWDGGGDREVGGGEDGDGRRGSGIFISVYRGSSCALLLGDSLNVRMGAEDSWVGVVDGDSGDMGLNIWLVDISCVVWSVVRDLIVARVFAGYV